MDCLKRGQRFNTKFRHCWFNSRHMRTRSLSVLSTTARSCLRILIRTYCLGSSIILVALPNCSSNLIMRHHICLTWCLRFKSQLMVFFCNCVRKLHDIILSCSTNMSNCIFHYFNTTLSIVCYNITSDIRITMWAVHNNTIKSTLFNFISPDEWHRPCFVIVTNYLHAIFVRFWYLVVK